jgi:L-rhamnose mutarotase
MKRYAHIIELKPEHAPEYRRLHAAVWPDVLKQIHRSNIRNYSIYQKLLPDGRLYLFSYFEYVGTNFDADMAAIAADPRTQEWWAVCKPCQQPLPEVDVAAGGWWADMEEVFHTD